MSFGLPPWLRKREAAPEPEPAPERLVEPTPDEARNGWDAASLTAYHAERQAAASETIMRPRPPRPTRQNGGVRVNGRMQALTWRR